MVDDSTKPKIATDESDGFIPVPKDTSTVKVPPPPPVDNSKLSLADKLKTARLAMQGPERTIERERSEREKQINQEKKSLTQSLALIGKKKEDLEISWVVLDTKRIDLKKMLGPLLEEEEKIEQAEEELEGKERTSPVPADRQKIEKERWTLQDKRKEIEKQKWVYEDKIQKIEDSIKENTDKYQTFLDEEEATLRKIEDLDSEVSLIEEQVRLEEEEAKHKVELAREDAEKKRREEAAKKEQIELEKKHQEALAKKAEEEKLKKVEDDKKRAEETKNKTELDKARQMANLEMERAKASAVAQRAIDEAKKKAEEAARIAILNKPQSPSSSAPVGGIQGLNAPASVSQTAQVKPQVAFDQKTTLPENETALETEALPKLRTLKTDMDKIKGSSTPNTKTLSSKIFPDQNR